jgi:hypothetical protein
VHVGVAQLTWIWEVTAQLLLIFYECSRDRSSMFRESMLPPKFSW